MDDLLGRFGLRTRYNRFAYWWGDFVGWLAGLKGTAIFIGGIGVWIVFWCTIDQWWLWGSLNLAPATAVGRAGLCLKPVSVIVLAIGLGRLQKHFDITPWWRKPLAWLRAFPTQFESRTFTARGAMASVSPSGTAHGRVIRENEALEEKVERLEEEINDIRNQLRDVKSALEEEIESVRDEIEQYKEKQSDKIESIEDSLERVAIDDLMWEGIALGWLFVGQLMSSQPVALAEWLQFLLEG